jgi:hypothetical protein
MSTGPNSLSVLRASGLDIAEARDIATDLHRTPLRFAQTPLRPSPSFATSGVNYAPTMSLNVVSWRYAGGLNPWSACEYPELHRIIYCIFQRFNLDWKNRISTFLHKQLDIIGTIEFDIP